MRLHLQLQVHGQILLGTKLKGEGVVEDRLERVRKLEVARLAPGLDTRGNSISSFDGSGHHQSREWCAEYESHPCVGSEICH